MKGRIIMLSTILASIGTGIGIFLALLTLDAITIRIAKTNYQVHSTAPSAFVAMATIAGYFIIGGASELMTIGLTLMIFLPIHFVIGRIMLLLCEMVDDGHPIKDPKFCAAELRITINQIITSVFAVLIINHFGLI